MSLLLYFLSFSFVLTANFSDENGNNMFYCNSAPTYSYTWTYYFRGKDAYTLTSYQLYMKKYTTSPSASDTEYDCGASQCGFLYYQPEDSTNLTLKITFNQALNTTETYYISRMLINGAELTSFISPHLGIFPETELTTYDRFIFINKKISNRFL